MAELALFDRDPGAYQTKTAEKSRPPSEGVTIDDPSVGRFLEFLRSEMLGGLDSRPVTIALPRLTL